MKNILRHQPTRVRIHTAMVGCENTHLLVARDKLCPDSINGSDADIVKMMYVAHPDHLAQYVQIINRVVSTDNTYYLEPWDFATDDRNTSYMGFAVTANVFKYTTSNLDKVQTKLLTESEENAIVIYIRTVLSED